MPAASTTNSPNRHPGSLPTVIPAKAGIYACRLHHHSRGCTAPDSGASRNNGCRGAENGENRRPTAVNRNITTRPRRPNYPPPQCRPPPPRHTFSTPTRPAATTCHPNHPKPKLPCPPAAFPTRPCGHIHRHTASPNRHTCSPQPSFRRKPESTPAVSITNSPNRHPVSPPTVIPAKAGIYACRPHHHSRGRTTPESGASRNNGCRGAENGENRRRTAVNRNITIRLDALTIPHPNVARTPCIPSELPLAPQLRPAIPTTREQSCLARRPRPQPARVDIFTVIPSPPTVIPSPPTVIPSPPTVIPSPPTVIPAQAGIHACRSHCRLPQPSFRRKPESTPVGSITVSPNRHPASPNRHSGFRRNLWRAVTFTVIPACAGIQAAKNPYRQPRQSFQLVGLTSRNPHTARNPGIPPASRLPRQYAPRPVTFG